MNIPRKQHKVVILDVESYDDLHLDQLDWHKLLNLEGSEQVSVKIKEPYESLLHN
jgi:hypothetical protein